MSPLICYFFLFIFLFLRIQIRRGRCHAFRLFLDILSKLWLLLTALLIIIIPMCLQIVKVWSEDGAGKVVEIPADMTARDVCQLLVYKSHCLDDNAWALVEHHPILGLGKELAL